MNLLVTGLFLTLLLSSVEKFHGVEDPNVFSYLADTRNLRSQRPCLYNEKGQRTLAISIAREAGPKLFRSFSPPKNVLRSLVDLRYQRGFLHRNKYHTGKIGQETLIPKLIVEATPPGNPYAAGSKRIRDWFQGS